LSPLLLITSPRRVRFGMAPHPTLRTETTTCFKCWQITGARPEMPRHHDAI
jgi:hypothetical protein